MAEPVVKADCNYRILSLPRWKCTKISSTFSHDYTVCTANKTIASQQTSSIYLLHLLSDTQNRRHIPQQSSQYHSAVQSYRVDRPTSVGKEHMSTFLSVYFGESVGLGLLLLTLVLYMLLTFPLYSYLKTNCVKHCANRFDYFDILILLLL